MLANFTDKIMMFFINFKLHFLTGDSDISSVSKGLGIESKSGTDIGKSVIPAIKNVSFIIALVSAIGIVAVVGIQLIISKKQEQRSEAMQRLLWVFIGICVVSFAVGLVGYAVQLFQ